MTSVRHHRTKPVPVIERYRNATNHRLRIGQFGLPVARNIYTDLMSQCGQSARQRAHYIRQSTSLGIRNALGSCKRNMHENHS